MILIKIRKHIENLREKSELFCKTTFSTYGIEKSFKDSADIIECLLDEVESYRAIGTVEECRVAVERMKPKKPTDISKVKDGIEFVGLIGKCPCCGHIVGEDAFTCDNCFQVIDWSI